MFLSAAPRDGLEEMMRIKIMAADDFEHPEYRPIQGAGHR